jgi:hypothetical protein
LKIIEVVEYVPENEGTGVGVGTGVGMTVGDELPPPHASRASRIPAAIIFRISNLPQSRDST